METKKNKNTKAITNKRKNIRFNPDPGVIAWIDAKTPALIREESAGGAGLVVISSSEIKVGQVYSIKVGKLGEYKSEVRWVTKLDKKIYLIGIQYLE